MTRNTIIIPSENNYFPPNKLFLSEHTWSSSTPEALQQQLCPPSLHIRLTRANSRELLRELGQSFAQPNRVVLTHSSLAAYNIQIKCITKKEEEGRGYMCIASQHSVLLSCVFLSAFTTIPAPPPHTPTNDSLIQSMLIIYLQHILSIIIRIIDAMHKNMHVCMYIVLNR